MGIAFVFPRLTSPPPAVGLRRKRRTFFSHPTILLRFVFDPEQRERLHFDGWNRTQGVLKELAVRPNRSKLARAVSQRLWMMTAVLALLLGFWAGEAAERDGVVEWGETPGPMPEAGQHGIAAISANGTYTVALTSEGAVLAWGIMNDGQSDAPVSVPGDVNNGVVAIAAGGNHILALKSNGSVVAWGNNQNKQTNVPLAAQGGIKAIAAGRSHSLALTDDGAVISWGSMTNVPLAARRGVIAIAAGQNHSVALKSSGEVLAWGINYAGQTDVPAAARSGVAKVFAGPLCTAAVKADGSVVMWGQLFRGTIVIPAEVPDGLGNVQSIAVGGHHVVALKTDGSIVTWGKGETTLLTVPETASQGAAAIAAGYLHSVALVAPRAPKIVRAPENSSANLGQCANLSVEATGYGLTFQWRKDGQDIPGATGSTLNLRVTRRELAGSYAVVVTGRLGSVTSSPAALNVTFNAPTAGAVIAWGAASAAVPAAALSEVTSVAAGAEHSVALKADGSVLAWGQLWNGSSNVSASVPKVAMSGVAAVAAGANHVVALKTDGSVVAWGANWAGQTEVPIAARVGVVAVAAGISHSAALKSDGSVVGWGKFQQSYWQQGGPVLQAASVPEDLRSGVVEIAAANEYLLALKSDGSVVTWGYPPTDALTGKLPVATRSGVVAIAAGERHALALKFDGSVVAWGQPYPVYRDATVPAGLGRVRAVAAGGGHSVALTAEGGVVAWERNELGQASVPATAWRDVFAIAAGNNQSLAIVAPAAPEITRQPESQIVTQGRVAGFSVTASGYPLSYQWRKDGQDIPNATGAVLNLGLLRRDQEGSFTVVVSNRLGSLTSSPPARLTVLPSPSSPGAVFAWGSDAHGQIRVPLAAQNDVVAIAAGGAHTLALKADGSVLAWGNNDYGQTDVPPEAKGGVTAISAGYFHNLALKTDGSVVAWGRTPTADYKRVVPISVPANAAGGVVGIAAGARHSLALKNDGSVVAWGNTPDDQFDVPWANVSDAKAVSTLGDSIWILMADGSVAGWSRAGWSRYGTPLNWWPNSGQSEIKAIAGAMALRADGSVVSLGYEPTAIPLPVPGEVAAIATGYYQNLALKTDGSVVARETNRFEESGVPAVARHGVTAISVGDAHSVALISPTPIKITGQSHDQTLNVGQSVSFTVVATGYPINCQWFKDGREVPGATGTTCNLGLARPELAGTYAAVLSSHLGSVTSAPVAVRVTENPREAGSPMVWGTFGYSKRAPAYVPAEAQSGVVAMAAGDYHDLALKRDGTVVAWGANSVGQTEVPVSLQGQASAVAVGDYHSLALTTGGSVVVWGKIANRGGELVPDDLPPEAKSEVVAIAAGGSFTLALKTNGSVLAWGRDYVGQTNVPAAAKTGVVAIAAREYNAVALKIDGSVVVWGGRNPGGRPPLPATAQNGVTTIAVNDNLAMAVKADGELIVWDFETAKLVPVPAPAKFNVVAATSGFGHALALKADGSVVPWVNSILPPPTLVPSGLQGVISIASSGPHVAVIAKPFAPSISAPATGQIVSPGQPLRLAVEASGFPLFYQWRKDGADLVGATNSSYGVNYAEAGTAGSYSVVVRNHLGSVTNAVLAVVGVNRASPGTVVAWGDNSSQQATVPLSAKKGVVAIAAGALHSVALRVDGSVVAWGDNSYGQTEVPTAAQRGIKAIAACWNHSAALTDSGAVVVWGNKGNEPKVPFSALAGVTGIAVGGLHVAALKEDGSVIIWGFSSSAVSTIEVPEGALSRVVAIASGSQHVLALKANGSVIAWGDANDGKTRVPEAAQSGVVAVAGGTYHSVALKNDGSVIVWGNNDYGQRNLPDGFLGGVASVVTSFAHNVARRFDGSVIAWGLNDRGQIRVPTVAQHGVTAVAAGSNHSMALLGSADSLQAFPSPEGLTIAWPVDRGGILQSALNLTSDAVWTDLLDAPALSGDLYSVTHRVDDEPRFFRLRE